MKKFWSVLWAPLLVLGGCCSQPEKVPPLQLTAKSAYQIVLPDTAPNSGTLRHLRTGAVMLQNSFEHALGVKFPIVAEKQVKAGVPGIYVGATEFAEKVGIDAKKYANFAYTLQVKGKNIFIVGYDHHNFHRTDETRAGSSRFTLGSLNGMIRFAEDYLGTRFLFPGQYGVDWPVKRSAVTLPGDLYREVFPPLIMSRGRYKEMLYTYANNAYGGGCSWSYGGHSYPPAVPIKKYAKTHPEYFAMIGQKRVPTGNHLCISNPQVQELIYQEMVKRIKYGANIVQLAQTDGYMPCNCPECLKYGNTSDPGEKLWIMHINLAKRLLKEYPGKYAHIIAYGPTKNPPKSIKKFPPNVIVEMCSYSAKDFAAWRQVEVPGGFTTYVYNWGSYNQPGFAPKMTPKSCAEQVQLFLKNHVRGVYRCGFGENFGLEGPTYYVYGKMFNDPRQNYHEILEDFYHRAYHQAYAPMRDFHNMLNARLAMYYKLKGEQSLEGGMDNDNMLPQNPRVIMAAIYTPDLLDALERKLSRAEKMTVQDKVVQERLKLVRFEFDYVKNLGQILHLYNAYRINPNWSNFDQLAQLIDARNALINRAYRPNGRSRQIPGWPINYFDHALKSLVLTNGRQAALMGSPLTWNIKLLREKKLLPGVGKKSVKVLPVVGKVPFDDFTSGVWKNAQWQHLGGIQLGAIRSATRFKVLYSPQALYLGIIADLPATLRYPAAGPDGRVWNRDCLEIMLDPEGNREIYYHLAYNPVANSYYDSAFGLIKDVLHPKYNHLDDSWNGKWSYQTRRNGDKWYSLVEIPYTTLNVAPPQPGAVWLMNLGREDLARRPLELSLWSPNLETMSFHDRDSFGELVFQ